MPSPGSVTAGRVLRLRRHQLGLSQACIAQRARVTVQYVCDVEADRRRPRLRIAQRLARALEVEPTLLCGALGRVLPKPQLEALAALINTYAIQIEEEGDGDLTPQVSRATDALEDALGAADQDR